MPDQKMPHGQIPLDGNAAHARHSILQKTLQSGPMATSNHSNSNTDQAAMEALNTLFSVVQSKQGQGSTPGGAGCSSGQLTVHMPVSSVAAASLASASSETSSGQLPTSTGPLPTPATLLPVMPVGGVGSKFVKKVEKADNTPNAEKNSTGQFLVVLL